MYAPDRIFPIPEIESMIFTHLDPIIDLKQLTLVSQYYHQAVNTISFYVRLRAFIRNSTKKERQMDKLGVNKHRINNLTRACFYGKQDITEYLLTIGKYNLHDHFEGALRYACAGVDHDEHLGCDRFRFVLWLYNLDGKCNISKIDNYVLFRSCRGRLDIFIWIYNLFCCVVTNYRFNHSYFNKACKDGYTDIVIWMYNLPNNIDHTYIKNSIQDICYKGHLDMVLILYNMFGVSAATINIEQTFKGICQNSRLDVAIWFYNMFHRDIAKVIVEAAILGMTKQDIVTWLLLINDRVNTISFDQQVITYSLINKITCT